MALEGRFVFFSFFDFLWILEPTRAAIAGFTLKTSSLVTSSEAFTPKPATLTRTSVFAVFAAFMDAHRTDVLRAFGVLASSRFGEFANLYRVTTPVAVE